MVSVFQIFAIFGIVSGWSEKALADGKVTLEEATSLIEKLAKVLAIPTETQFLTPQLDLDDKVSGDIEPDITIDDNQPLKQRPPD